MTIKIRQAKTGETEAIFRNVKHFLMCSTGATPNSRTLYISKRYDRDDELTYELGVGVFLSIEE